VTVAALVDLVETECAVRLSAERGRLVLVGSVPPAVRAALRDFRRDLVSYLTTGADAALDPAKRGDPAALGFQRLYDKGPVSHVRGDEIGDRVLAGLVDPTDLTGTAPPSRSSSLPTAEPIVLRPGRYPGHFRFVLEKGKRYQPLPFETAQGDNR
jgi:hypothetical protein